MTHSEAAPILTSMQALTVKTMRRFSIGVIAVVILSVLSNYIYNSRRRPTPPQESHRILGAEMALSAEGIEHSENRGGASRFKIRAQKRMETRGGRNYLQGIEAFDFNEDGSVRNSYRSQRAEYDRERGIADFSGDVRIIFNSGMELQTDSLQYDQNTNVGTTDDRLQLRSGAAEGTALGVRFDQKTESLSLDRDVNLVLIQKRVSPNGATEQMKTRVTSDKAFLSEPNLVFRFQGRAHVDSGAEALSGDEIEATLSSDRKHFRSLISNGNAAYRFREGEELRNLSGDRIALNMNEASGNLQDVRVSGRAAFSSISGDYELDLKAAEIFLELDPAGGLPVKVQSTDRARFQVKSGGEQKTASGGRIQANFAAGTKQLDSIHISNNAVIHEKKKDSSESDLQSEEIRLFFEPIQGGVYLNKLQAEGSAKWVSVSDDSSESSKTLEASWLELEYSQGNFPKSGFARGHVLLSAAADVKSNASQIRQLRSDDVQFAFYPGGGGLKDMQAKGHVRVNYEKMAGPQGDGQIERFVTESDGMEATFLPSSGGGAIEKAVQRGNFHYRDNAKSAAAGKCAYESGKETLVLTESPEISEAAMGVTSGESIVYDQKRKILFVHRGVKTVLNSKSGEKPLGASSGSSFPVIVTAGELEYYSDAGEARYTGNVRMLSEEQQLQSEEMDILEGGERISARGAVRHFVYSSGMSPLEKHPDPGMKKTGKTENMPISVQSAKLQYVKELNVINYTGGVILRSADFIISSEALDIERNEEANGIQRATAHKKVVIYQGPRVCRGDVAEYYTNPNRFEVLGSPAEIEDPSKLRSSAPKLTFYIDEDRTRFENR